MGGGHVWLSEVADLEEDDSEMVLRLWPPQEGFLPLVLHAEQPADYVSLKQGLGILWRHVAPAVQQR
eukprot:SAG25_NODE_81_length_16694_cov_8.663332_17_plen_67_part_00